MSGAELHLRSLADIAADVGSGRTRALDVVRSAMAAVVRCENGPEPLNAFITYSFEGAQTAAAEIDALVANGSENRPLAGVPVAVKENICTLDFPTTCGSRILAGYRSPYEATAIRRLRAAGAVVVGKTNMDEFAMGS